MQKHSAPKSSTPSKPCLKWIGGKTRLLSQIIPALPTGRRLVEPFVGGGSVFLGTDFSEYMLGDNNPDLINLYRELATHPEQFIEIASSYFCEAYRSQEKYLEVRRAFNAGSESSLMAAQFLYLNQFGFNGLCRYNRSGKFNVPYGHKSRVPRFPKAEILNFAWKAQRATLVCGDFASMMQMAKPGDVVYCDPPYLDRDEAASFRAYGPNEFSLDQQRELAELARELARRGIPVAISNHDCETARELYSGAKITEFVVRRSVSATSSARVEVAELLAVFD
jgi:DNA adenine methylase